MQRDERRKEGINEVTFASYEEVRNCWELWLVREFAPSDLKTRVFILSIDIPPRLLLQHFCSLLFSFHSLVALSNWLTPSTVKLSPAGSTSVQIQPPDGQCWPKTCLPKPVASCARRGEGKRRQEEAGADRKLHLWPGYLKPRIADWILLNDSIKILI